MTTQHEQFEDNAGAAGGAVTEGEAALQAQLKAAMDLVAKLTKEREDRLAAEEAKSNKPGVANESRSASKERFKIIIEDARDANDMTRVYVGVNGRGYWLQRGKEIEVPREVIKVLDNAILDKAIPLFDESTGMPKGLEMRKSRRFPYQLLGKSVDAAGNKLATRSIDDIS